MAENRIVAVGFLTERDLDVLGTGFRRLLPVKQDALFDDLLEQLDRIEAVPMGKGVVLRRAEPGDDQ